MTDPPIPDHPLSVADDLHSIAQRLDVVAADVWASLDRGDLADLLAVLDATMNLINGAASEVARLLASLMEADEEEIGIWHVTRKEGGRFQWDGQRARSAVRAAIRRRIACDPETGEVVEPIADAVDEALDLAFACTSTGPKAPMLVTGMEALRLFANDYREWESTGTFKVTVAPKQVAR